MSEQTPPSAERRIAVRYSCTLKTLCQRKTARPEDFWWWGKVQDISTNGIGLVLRRPFEPGTLLLIEPLAGEEVFQTLLARVIRATKQAPAGWLLGCEFASQLVAGRFGVIPELVPVPRSSSVWDCFDVT